MPWLDDMQSLSGAITAQGPQGMHGGNMQRPWMGGPKPAFFDASPAPGSLGQRTGLGSAPSWNSLTGAAPGGSDLSGMHSDPMQQPLSPMGDIPGEIQAPLGGLPQFADAFPAPGSLGQRAQPPGMLYQPSSWSGSQMGPQGMHSSPMQGSLINSLYK